MSKKRAIINFVVVSVIVLLGLIFSFISFDVAGKNYKYMGFAKAIYQGLDYGGGVYAEYEAVRPEGMSDEDFNSKLDDTYKRIESVFNTKGISNAFISKTSNGGIRVEAPNKDDASDILATIGSGILKIRTSSSTTQEPIVTGDQVLAAFATNLQTGTNTYQWGAYVSFDDEATTALKNATEKASQNAVTLYMFRGDSETAFFSLNVSSTIDGFMFISSAAMSQSYAEELALQLYSGSLPLTMETVGSEIFTIEASMGREAILGTAIALGVLMLILLLVFVVRYREFGLMICLSTLLFTGIMLFLLQAIPLFELSVGGMAGVLASIILFAALHIIIFERIKREYANGKKISAAVKAGFKKSNGLVSDISIVLMAVGFLCYFIGTGALKTFAVGIFVGSLISLVISLFVTKQLTDSYVVFNKTNEKRVNLKREEGIDEIG